MNCPVHCPGSVAVPVGQCQRYNNIHGFDVTHSPEDNITNYLVVVSALFHDLLTASKVFRGTSSGNAEV